MAIAFDASSQFTGPDQSISFSHTTGSGDNRGIVISTIQTGAAGNLFVSYDGYSAMPLGPQALSGFSSMNIISYYVANPTSGTKTVVVQRNDDNGPNSIVLVSSFSGLSNIQPDSINPTNTTATGPFTVSDTVINSNCWLLGIGADFSLDLTGITSNRTTRQSATVAIGTSKMAAVLSDSNGTVSTGSQSVIFTASNSGGVASENYAAIVLALYPFTTAPSTGDTLFSNGD